MGYVTISPGDRIRVMYQGQDHEFIAGIADGGGVEITQVKLCEGCAQNDASEFEYYGHHLCPRCVERGLQYIAYHAALEHVMANDEELANTLSVLEQIDNDNLHSTVQFIDSHSAAFDQAWGESPGELRTICHEISESTYNVLEAHTLVDRV